MKHRITHVLASALAVAILAVAPIAQAAKPDKNAATSVVTVYISGHGGSSIAKKLNEMHARMEKDGWRFADLEIHSENSDTEGAWVTYVK